MATITLSSRDVEYSLLFCPRGRWIGQLNFPALPFFPPFSLLPSMSTVEFHEMLLEELEYNDWMGVNYRKGENLRPLDYLCVREDERFGIARLWSERESYASETGYYYSDDDMVQNHGLEAPAMELSSSKDSIESTEVNEYQSLDTFDHLPHRDDDEFGSPETQCSALAEGDGEDEDKKKSPGGGEEHRQSPHDFFEEFCEEFVRSAAPSPERREAQVLPMNFIVQPAECFDGADTGSLPMLVSEQCGKFAAYGQYIFTDAFTDHRRNEQLWISQCASDFQKTHARAEVDGDPEFFQPMMYDSKGCHPTPGSLFEPSPVSSYQVARQQQEESPPEPAPSLLDQPLVPSLEPSGQPIPRPAFSAAPAPPPGFSAAPAGLSPSQFTEAAVTGTLVPDLLSIEKMLSQIASQESVTLQIIEAMEERRRQGEAQNYPWFTFSAKRVCLVRNWEYIVPYWGSNRDEKGRVVRRVGVGIKSKLNQVLGIDEVDDWVATEERRKQKRRMVREGKEKVSEKEVAKMHVTRKKPWVREDVVQGLGVRRGRRYLWCSELKCTE